MMKKTHEGHKEEEDNLFHQVKLFFTVIKHFIFSDGFMYISAHRKEPKDDGHNFQINFASKQLPRKVINRLLADVLEANLNRLEKEAKEREFSNLQATSEKDAEEFFNKLKGGISGIQ